MDDIKYYENLDTKAGNVKLLKRNVPKNVQKL
jgi:hypothetical protein